MEQKIYMNYIHPSSLLRQLSDLWKSNQLCDAAITVDNVIVARAHRVVLHAVSSKLKADSSATDESSILNVSLPSGVSHASVQAFLQYIYEGYLILTKDVAHDLLIISDFLRIKCLTNCCRDYLNSLEGLMAKDKRAAEVKTEELTHVRTSKWKDPSKKRHKSNDSNNGDGNTSKAKKHRKAATPTRTEILTPSDPHVKQRDSPALRSESVTQETGGASDFDENSKDRLIRDSPSRPSRMDADEQSNSTVDYESDWRPPGDTTDASNSNTMSESFQKNTLDIQIKEEPQDENFEDESSAQGDGQMWFSTESGSIEALNQTAPVGSVSSPVAGTSGDNLQPKSLTPYPSLAQMRAQHSLKRSVQGPSYSVARRYRAGKSTGESGETFAPDDGGGGEGDEPQTEEDGAGQGSQEGKIALKTSCKIVPAEDNSEDSIDLLMNKPRRRYSCDICVFSTPHPSNLTRHKRSVHRSTTSSKLPNPSMPDFLCDCCGKVFKTRTGLTLHERSKHEMIFKYSCTFPGCDRKFNQLWNFKGHRASHSVKHREKCDYCGQTFVYKCSLINHKKVCKKSGLPPPVPELKCGICGNMFLTKSNLLDHMRGKHTEQCYRCSECGRIFKWRSSLSYHIRSTGHSEDWNE